MEGACHAVCHEKFGQSFRGVSATQARCTACMHAALAMNLVLLDADSPNCCGDRGHSNVSAISAMKTLGVQHSGNRAARCDTIKLPSKHLANGLVRAYSLTVRQRTHDRLVLTPGP